MIFSGSTVLVLGLGTRDQNYVRSVGHVTAFHESFHHLRRHRRGSSLTLRKSGEHAVRRIAKKEPRTHLD